MATSDQASSRAVTLNFSYTVPIACGTIAGDCCECTPLVPGRYATAITLLNPSPRPVEIHLNVAPTTLAGATAGRWPDTVQFRGADAIKLGPEKATTIDCCTVAKLLLGAVAPTAVSATYGIVWIKTFELLEVSATYTSVGDEGTSPSIDVEIIEPRRLPPPEKVKKPERPSENPPSSSQTPGRRGAKSN